MHHPPTKKFPNPKTIIAKSETSLIETTMEMTMPDAMTRDPHALTSEIDTEFHPMLRATGEKAVPNNIKLHMTTNIVKMGNNISK
mmetsp:Transcript_42410/g.90235  ORF Transcript_42410/g.90235 Transcript_42410/m.90235 type:complete len:85 (-) Transcript_42410:847-1101(-)